MEPLLHNETAFLIQRRLQHVGVPMIVLPVQLDLTVQALDGISSRPARSGLTTAVGLGLFEHLASADLVMLYLLAIGAGSSSRWAAGPPSPPAASRVAGLRLLLRRAALHPSQSTTSSYLLTFATMFAVGLILSGLTQRLKKESAEARAGALQTAGLYALARDLGAAQDESRVARIGAEHAARAMGAEAVVCSRRRKLSGARSLGGAARAGPRELPMAAAWSVEHGRSAGAGTTAVPDARLFCVPLRASAAASRNSAGALGGRLAGNADQRRFLEAMARHLALAVTRARLAEQAASANLSAKTESMRSRAVEHRLARPAHSARADHRCGVNRCATERALSNDTRGAAAVDREEAERLERLVANLLEMTRSSPGGPQAPARLGATGRGRELGAEPPGRVLGDAR